ncbi:substrate-binding domain-containing protein [Caloramator sp. Dgby_cultured_2]|uniref:substrate-binding domain-containing protein n=1 Tax=Caloramator sp. Dgby_cultured_2 TaxID=3029174 RepID=UPI00237E2FC9|nr:substrate-binding domain-containing protein [Caloramator sp. Dgby_cultured_2]WDU82767.1 substrate-binding domain-containing protein [Caloramator sp. Dgby_cultured_2]
MCPRFSDIREELKYIDIATLAKVDGIITHAFNTEDFTKLIDRAYYKGIPVITLENDNNKSKRYAFVGTNSFEIGKKAALLLIKATGEGLRLLLFLIAIPMGILLKTI